MTSRHRLRNDRYCVGWGVKLYSVQIYDVTDDVTATLTLTVAAV